MKYEIEGSNWNWGDTIQERLQWQQTIGAKLETEQAQKVMQAQLDAYTEEPAAGVTDKKAWKAGADSRFIKRFAEDQYKIGEGSVFEAPAYSVFAQYSPQISNHIIWKDYIHTAAANIDPTKAINPQLIINATVQAIRDGKVRQPEAKAFVQQLFQQAVEINNEVHKFERITGGQRQKAFDTKLKTGMLGGQKYYDLTNSAQIDLAIAESVRNSAGTKPSPFASVDLS